MTPRRLLLLALAGAAAACERAAPVEGIRLIATPRGAPVVTYTLADETRPILAAPPEHRLQLTVPAAIGETYAFPLPPDVTGEALIATGVLQRDKRTYPFYPQWLRITADGAGGRRASLTLPPLARGPGAETTLTLVLTAPPGTPSVETRTGMLAIPARATLHVAYGLSDAAGVGAAAPVALEIAAVDAEGHEQPLWTRTLHLRAPPGGRWHELALPLHAQGGAHLALVFRARAAGEGRPVLVPLWADPTIVHPGARPPERRNVILISLDTLRADRVGVYGAYRPTTPALDALAARSVVFTDASAPWPETSGSHMSLFTSRFPSEHGVHSFVAAPSDALELMAERLRREGYLTRAFTEDGGVWAYAGFARGFSAYSERRSPDFVYRGEAAATFDNAARWLGAHADRTFFLFIHTYQVHAPYAPPADYRSLFADVPGREPGRLADDALAYDRETRYTDDQLARFFATLAKLDLAARSIVIITSDHGEEFGEHGGVGHGRTLHREVLHVPLIVWAPGLLAPARVAAPASLLDVYPTVLDLLGLDADSGHRGTSLAAAARGDPAAGPPLDRPIFAEVDRSERARFHMVAVRQAGRAAILDLGRDALRCYGADDPAERTPGSECPDLATLIAAHRAAMTPLGGRSTLPPDPRLVEKMRALGYVE